MFFLYRLEKQLETVQFDSSVFSLLQLLIHFYFENNIIISIKHTVNN